MKNKVCLNALFLQNHLDGIGNYCFYLVKNLLDQNPSWHFSLLVHREAARHFRVFEPRLEIIEVDLKSTALRLLYLHLVFPFRVLRFDLLHSVTNSGMIPCLIPQVITIHDTYECVSPERFGWVKRKQLEWVKALSGRNAKWILADSEHTRKDVERFYPSLRGKIQVVRLGSKFPVGVRFENEDRRNFIVVGTLEPGKNLVEVLKAFALFSQKHRHKLLIIGAKGWKTSPLPAILDSLKLGDSVELCGYLPDAELKEIYGRSLAMVHASSYEGFGLPVLEAMACGCPVILARNSSLIEVGGDAALFFETHDVRGMADRMERLSSDPLLVKDRVQKGFEHVRNFSWEKTARETAGAYRRCLK